MIWIKKLKFSNQKQKNMSVLVYTENWEGEFKKKTFELVSYANEVAEKTGSEVTAISIGDVSDEELQKLGKYGASDIVHYDTKGYSTLDNKLYSKLITETAQEKEAGIVIVADNFTGKAIAPRISASLKAGMVAGVIEVPSSFDPIVVKSKAFSGKAFANVKINSEKKILALQTNSFEITENPRDASIERKEADTSLATTKREEVSKVKDQILLTDAELIVSGGRGMKSPDNWEGIEELASLLGAATGCSRPVSDEGWRPHTEHVGQTGKVVAPTVYFAMGISGAIQHLAGISGSKYIVAVNKDEEAPIFNAADFGVVGDVNEVIPKMIEAVKAKKGK